jgi:monovalent cation/proton antiporter MnhG/PhaG subunit
MSENAVVDVLLGVGVTLELLCCLGVAVMRTTYDRLHYLSGATAVGPFVILAALLVREGLSSQTLDAIAAVSILFLAGPALVHAMGRAARRIDYGSPEAQPEERQP